jgi:hypothetical protein
MFFWLLALTMGAAAARSARSGWCDSESVNESARRHSAEVPIESAPAAIDEEYMPEAYASAPRYQTVDNRTWWRTVAIVLVGFALWCTTSP